MRRAVLFFLLLAACGGGGAAPSAPRQPAILSITGPLDSGAGTAFTITGVDLPAKVATRVTVRFTAVSGAPFDACRESVVTAPAIHATPETVGGTSPTVILTEDTPCFVTLVYGAGVEVTSATPIARFLGVPNVDVDQDLDGTPDRCDPNTYDFEEDSPGQRPAGMSQLDGVDGQFVVAAVDGDRVARYEGGASGGVYDRFDRFRQDVPHQDVTAWVDFDATPSIASLEFWSDGSWAGSAGAGLILQVRSGLLYFFQRIWRSVPAVIGPALPASGRIRVRLRKEAGNTSTMYVDAWELGAWTLDYAVFPIADDRPFRGLDTVMGDFSGGTRGVERITLIREVPAAPLTIAKTPGGTTDWKLFQRDDADRATISVPVLYSTAEPVTLEARIVETATGTELPGHRFADHGLALPGADGGRATLDLAGVPTGGNYDVEVRLVNATGAVLGSGMLDDLAVGDVYLAIGQSNMAGYSHSLAGATTPIPAVHLFGNDGRWKQASEPMDDGTDQLDAVSREFPQHSLMLPFAKHLYEHTGVPVAVIPAPLGGTNLYAQWQRYAPDPDHRVTLYGSALSRVRVQGYATPVRGILWYQGESDSIAGRTLAQYRTDLAQLVANYRADLGAPDAFFFCVQLGTWSAGGFPNWTNIQEAQRQVCRADAHAALATVHDQARSDGIHYAVSGYQELGRRLADQARVLVFGHALDPLAELVEAVAVSGGTAVELRYDAPVTGGQTSLFEVTDDLGTNALTGVSATGSTVTLQLTRARSGAAVVRYGMSAGPAAAWVVDANGVAVPAFADVPID